MPVLYIRSIFRYLFGVFSLFLFRILKIMIEYCIIYLRFLCSTPSLSRVAFHFKLRLIWIKTEKNNYNKTLLAPKKYASANWLPFFLNLFPCPRNFPRVSPSAFAEIAPLATLLTRGSSLSSFPPHFPFPFPASFTVFFQPFLSLLSLPK